MIPSPRWWRRFRSQRWVPPTALAIKAAVAASVAWWLATALPGTHDEYAYYAPFGAVLATRANVVGTIRESAQTVGAIVLGALVALAGNALFGRSVGTIAVVVGVGMVLSGVRLLGSSRTWVPEAAVFVLVVGGSSPAEYVLSYAGLTLLGVAVAVAIDVIVPAEPFVGLARSDVRLRHALADRLDQLADLLEHGDPATISDRRRHHTRFSARVEQIRRTTSQTAETRRANPRAHRWRSAVAEQDRRAAALEELALQVEHLSIVLCEGERRGARTVPLDPGVRPAACDALRRVAEAIRWSDGTQGSDDGDQRKRLAAAHARLREMAGALEPPDGGVDTPYQLTVAVVSVRRCLELLRAESTGAS